MNFQKLSISWKLINNDVYDNKGRLANCYPDVKEIIGELYDNNISVAYATHNLYKNHVTELLKISPIQTKDKLIKKNGDEIQIWPSDHFAVIADLEII